jgi:ectoine hydroxylase-related dioxygenase (phytanoyl-CoA dioxygenase family)
MTSTQTLVSVPRSTPAAEIAEIVERDGGVVIQGLLTQDQVAQLNVEIEPAMQALNPGSTHDHELMQAFHGVNTKRLTNLVTHSELFRNEIINDSLVQEIADHILLEKTGMYWMTAAQVIEIGPGNPAQPMHRDLENFWPLFELGSKGTEGTINFLIAFTDFTEENGATRVIPGSNHSPDFEDRGTHEDTIPAIMKRGDALLLSGKTAHSGGANQTSDVYRRAVAFAFNSSCFVGEEAYPFMVDMDLVKTLTPRAQRLLGFRSQYPAMSGGLWQYDYGELAGHLGLEDEDAHVGPSVLQEPTNG